MIVAKVDRDHLDPGHPDNRVGKTFELTQHGLEEIFTDLDLEHIESLKVRFRILDDDDEVYFGGWLYNDPDCEVQLTVLKWAMADAGATIIEIKVDGDEELGAPSVWIREIG